MTKLRDDVKELLDAQGGRELELFMCSSIDYGSGKQLLAKFEDIKITVTHLDNYGGEGQGENFWSVYQFTRRGEEALYIQFQGYYMSYDGATFHEYFFVEPRQVMVTQYFQINK
jgi:hypothetical protein